MDLPIKLPTDNLYKFLALAGLVTAAVGVVLPAFTNFQFQQAFFRWRGENYERAYRAGFDDPKKVPWNLLLDDSNEVILKRKAEIIEQLKRQHGRPLTRAEEYDAHAKAAGELLLSEQELFRLPADLLFFRARHDFTATYCSWIMPIGALISAVGFVLWWFKIQRWQDKTLKSEARRKETEPFADRLWEFRAERLRTALVDGWSALQAAMRTRCPSDDAFFKAASHSPEILIFCHPDCGKAYGKFIATLGDCFHTDDREQRKRLIEKTIPPFREFSEFARKELHVDPIANVEAQAFYSELTRLLSSNASNETS